MFHEKGAVRGLHPRSSARAACSCRPRDYKPTTSTCRRPRPTTRSAPVAGKVAWPHAGQFSGGRTQGGRRFPNDEKSRQPKIKIEEVLGPHLLVQADADAVAGGARMFVDDSHAT